MQTDNPWQDAMVDEAIVTWCLTEENKDDPEQMLRDIIATNIAWDRDPQISKRPRPTTFLLSTDFWIEVVVIAVCLGFVYLL